jgi:hypothetical protein
MQLEPERLRCETEIGNVLDLSEGLLERVAKADLITFLFVLNELFQDKKRTMLLVARIVAAMPSGAHMLVRSIVQQGIVWHPVDFTHIPLDYSRSWTVLDRSRILKLESGHTWST